MLDFIKSLGYDVYIRKPKQEYCFYTDGAHIGYAQWGGMEPRVCSVHKPSLSCGTGYSLFSVIKLLFLIIIVEMKLKSLKIGMNSIIHLNGIKNFIKFNLKIF